MVQKMVYDARLTHKNWKQVRDRIINHIKYFSLERVTLLTEEEKDRQGNMVLTIITWPAVNNDIYRWSWKPHLKFGKNKDLE